jgi:hypothetical protein
MCSATEAINLMARENQEKNQGEIRRKTLEKIQEKIQEKIEKTLAVEEETEADKILSRKLKTEI